MRTCIKGTRARNLVQQNRNTFSIDAAMGSDGCMYHPHVLFAGDSMASDMVPDCVAALEYMMISNNACGVQTGTTFLARLKNLEKEARARGVKGPIVYVRTQQMGMAPDSSTLLSHGWLRKTKTARYYATCI